MIIAIGADHRGYALKEALKKRNSFGKKAVSWIDVGAYNAERSDYPLFAHQVSKAILDGRADAGLLLCATGTGMAIAANRFKGIFAAVAWNEHIARASKEDDHSNVLVLPADDLSVDQAADLIEVWLSANPRQGRYEERLRQIDNEF